MNLLILGAGEYGMLVKEIASKSFSTIDFLDDNSKYSVGKISDAPLFKEKYTNAIVSIGNNETRMKMIENLESMGYDIVSIISDRAFVSPSAVIEQGCIVEPMAVISSNAIVKKGTIISSGAIVNHNAVVHECSHIDCNSVVGAGVVVPKKTHLNYGKTIIRTEKPDCWKFSE